MFSVFSFFSNSFFLSFLLFRSLSRFYWNTKLHEFAQEEGAKWKILHNKRANKTGKEKKGTKKKKNQRNKIGELLSLHRKEIMQKLKLILD